MNQLHTEQVGTYTPVTTYTLTEDEVIAKANEIVARRLAPGQLVKSPDDAGAYLQLTYSQKENEVFGALMLDTKHRILECKELSVGTLDAATVYPRGVVKSVLDINAGAVILFHNHPSGDATPSEADVKFTLQLKAALKTINVPVLDHLVVGFEGFQSLAALGKI